MTMDKPPELSVREGFTLPHDLPRGECTVTCLGDDALRVDHADPRVLISAKLLALMFVEAHPRVTLTMAPRPNGTPFWEGAVLKIDGINRTVIYRIREYIPAVHGYVAEWPD